MKNKMWRGISAVILALLMIGGASPATVRAESIYDMLISELRESLKNFENTSYLSAEKLFLGDTLSLVAQAEGVNAAKCQYAFFFRVKGMFWVTLQNYSKDDHCTWTPEAIGDYEICIKVKHGAKIVKKYFDIRVTRELYNHSYISTSFVQQGGEVELTGMGEGGFGKLYYGFFYKLTDEESWHTLSDYSQANSLRRKPQKAGTYDICINVMDDDGQTRIHSGTLTVAPPLAKTPTAFTITVKSPISSPYFWQCSIEDENLIGYEIVSQTVVMEKLETYILQEYRFTTLSAGRTSLSLSYDTHSGSRYALNYDITVDKNLNYTINQSDGRYFEGETKPVLRPIKGSFAIRVPEGENPESWKCTISDTLVAENDGTYEGEDGVYAFTVLRQGHFTVTFRCVSEETAMTDQYRLIYNLYADESLNVTLVDTDGYYIAGMEWPDIIGAAGS